MYASPASRLSYASIAALNLKKTKKIDGVSEPQSPELASPSMTVHESNLIARAKATEFLTRRRSVMPENNLLMPHPLRPNSTRPAHGLADVQLKDEEKLPWRPDSTQLDNESQDGEAETDSKASRIDNVLTRPEGIAATSMF